MQHSPTLPARNTHTYDVLVTWTGNRGGGTASYLAYSRDHEVSANGPPVLAASADPVFHGNRGRWNPEQELTAALSQCHMLTYLHLCATAGVVVTHYADQARGIMRQTPDGGGHFTEVVLHPHVTVASPDMVPAALSLHTDASARCFIAGSVNFPVRHEPVVVVNGTAGAA